VLRENQSAFLVCCVAKDRKQLAPLMPSKPACRGTDVFTYTNYSIRWVSKELPEGAYELNANGENTRVQLRNGFWIAA
jgi:hypothetical protein